MTDDPTQETSFKPLTISLTPSRVLPDQDKITAYAAQRARLLFGSYRKGEANDPKTYVAAIAATLARFPMEVITAVTHPVDGIAGAIDFLPTVAEVKRTCEATEAALHERAANDEAAKKRPPMRFIQGVELDGFTVAVRMAEQREPAYRTDPEKGVGVWSRLVDHQFDLARMADFIDEKPFNWSVVEQGTPQCEAWRKRLELWLGNPVKCDRVFLEPRSAEHDLPADHPDFKLRKSVIGLRIPAPWPPRRRDGVFAGEGDDNGGDA